MTSPTEWTNKTCSSHHQQDMYRIYIYIYNQHPWWYLGWDINGVSPNIMVLPWDNPTNEAWLLLAPSWPISTVVKGGDQPLKLEGFGGKSMDVARQFLSWESWDTIKNTYKKQNFLYKDYRDSTSKVMGQKAISIWNIYIYNCCINAIDVYEANTFHQVSVKKHE